MNPVDETVMECIKGLERSLNGMIFQLLWNESVSKRVLRDVPLVSILFFPDKIAA